MGDQTHSDKKGLISQAFNEATAYKELGDLETLVENSNSLAHLPIQPLYIALQNATTDLISEVLPKLSKEQRQAINDLSLWNRDKLDVENFTTMLEAYAGVKDEKVLGDFAQSHDFLLFLKGRLSIHTFDAEDPMYPDHDYYFLTDDMQLLIEYDENFEQVKELKLVISKLYSDQGVENAYSLLFKYVADAFSIMEEDSYYHKRERLREYGFVDYYEALEFLGVFQNEKQLQNYIQKKQKVKAPFISHEQLSQALHHRTLVGFKNIRSIEEELSKVNDQGRLEYLRFHLLRFINGTLTLNDALQKGATSISDSNKQSEKYLLLGYQYLMNQKMASISEISLFDVFDLFDCYKVGKSLIHIEKRVLKNELKKTIFEEPKYFVFLGPTHCEFIDHSFEEKFAFGEYLDFERWKNKLHNVIEVFPYAQKFYESYQQLKLDNKIQDSFYYNYKVEEIDLECILLSSFVNFHLGYYKNNKAGNKMGVTIKELITFSQILKKDENELLIELRAFLKQFGLEEITNMDAYMAVITRNHLEGYEFDQMTEEDFQHVGGPIILNPKLVREK